MSPRDFDNITETNELEGDEEKEEKIHEIPPKLYEAIKIIQQLRLFSVTQCPQIHHALFLTIFL